MKTKNVNKVVSLVKETKTTNNTQKVLVKLLSAKGGWVTREALFGVVSSATSRVRDLRKQAFGSFDVECVSSNMLKNSTFSRRTFLYRINPRNVTQRQVHEVMRIVRH